MHTSPEVFRQLYDETNDAHRLTHLESPTYIVGRKGAGKTTFLLGGALSEDAEVALIPSDQVYVKVNQLRARYAKEYGTIVTDALVHVWEVLLFHVAMLGLVQGKRQPQSYAVTRVWSYLSSFGDPAKLETDALLARVTARMSETLLAAPSELSFREACWSIKGDQGSFVEAASDTRVALSAPDARPIYVVVDNLEELHKRLDEFEDVVAAQFRMMSPAFLAMQGSDLPFKTRFAFPAELLQRLRSVTVSAEKDFVNYLVIRWTAAELIVVAGNRLRTFLDIYYPRAPSRFGLPRQHDPRDREAAAKTLRNMLPRTITNGFGRSEDCVAYLLRHTQLLPRHFIQILNEVMRQAVAPTMDEDLPARVQPSQVIKGVRNAERQIVNNILTSYSYQFPDMGKGLVAIKNRTSIVERASDLHRIFNHAGVAAHAKMSFEEFLQASVAMGALGIVTDGVTSDRYVPAEFSYTFEDELRPVEDRDSLCVHPLFMYQWFDERVIRGMGSDIKAVYPYGSDPEHVDLRI